MDEPVHQVTDSGRRKRRSLILAGGGLKVAFQAGVMQVWLDEAGIEFDHADGASGGLFNLAMLCQGMSGKQIADNWRALPILKGISPNWRHLLILPFARSLLKYDRWCRNIHTHWGLDFEAIRQTSLESTFNLYNFSRHRLEVWPAERITEEALISGVSLPTWFSPVEIENDLYIDAVYMTDANLIEAVTRGADELWIIWTVSERKRWRMGLIASYFHIIETAGNGRLHAELERIEESNRKLAEGEPAEFDHPVAIKLLRAEVPLHYLINFRARKFTRAVNLGVEEGRRWCLRNRIPFEKTSPDPVLPDPVSVSFKETMAGKISAESASSNAIPGKPRSPYPFAVDLSVRIPDIKRFTLDPDHPGVLTGQVHSAVHGNELDIVDGAFNLLVDTDTDRKHMYYHLWFHDSEAAPWTLHGYKEVFDDPGFDLWRDTTTLFVAIYPGHLDKTQVADSAPRESGVIRLSIIGFIRQLGTFRTRGPDRRSRLLGLLRFGGFFLGSLWQIYGFQAGRTQI